MRWRTALALLILALPATSRAAHGRLALSVLAGGGYASDVFVGAELGAGTMLQVIPGARLDLSLSPRWKLATSADFSYGHYVTSGFTSLAESGALEVRYLPGGAWDATLVIDAEHAQHSLGSPLDSSGGVGPSVFSTLAARISPLLRVRGLGLEWRLAGVATTRSSTATEGDIPEQELAVLGGWMAPLGREASLALTYKLDRIHSPRPDFTATAHALFALVDWRLAELDWQAQLQLQTTGFATGTREGSGRLTLSASYPVSSSLDLEATYSIAASRADEAPSPPAFRHLAFLAVRWRFLEVGW